MYHKRPIVMLAVILGSLPACSSDDAAESALMQGQDVDSVAQRYSVENIHKGHNFIIDRAVEKLVASGSKSSHYLRGKPEYVSALKFGVSYADNSQLNCMWSYVVGQHENNCESIHHYLSLGLIESELDADVALPGGYSAPEYSQVLFRLATDFWPSANGLRRPHLSHLVERDAGTAMVTGVGPRTHLGRSFVGGEPFCEKLATRAGVPYRTYCPRWPSWTGGDPKLESPSPSTHVSLRYLGWALHMVQDMSVPHHAMNKATRDHARYEESIDGMIDRNEFGTTVGDPIVELFGSLDDNGRGHDDIERFVRDFGSQTKSYCRSNDCERSNHKRYLVDRAIKASALLIEKFFRTVSYSMQFDSLIALRLEDPTTPPRFVCNYPGDRDPFKTTVAPQTTARVVIRPAPGQKLTIKPSHSPSVYKRVDLPNNDVELYVTNAGTHVPMDYGFEIDCSGCASAGFYHIDRSLPPAVVRAQNDEIRLEVCTENHEGTEAFTITNVGNGDLQITSMTLVRRSAEALHMAPVQPGPVTLGAFEKRSFEVRYDNTQTFANTIVVDPALASPPEAEVFIRSNSPLYSTLRLPVRLVKKNCASSSGHGFLRCIRDSDCRMGPARSVGKCRDDRCTYEMPEYYHPVD